MKPNEPVRKILSPMEFAEKRGALPVEPVVVPSLESSLDSLRQPLSLDVAGGEDGTLYVPSPSDALLCPLCRDGKAPAVHAGGATLFDYPTAQRDLLIDFITSSHPGLDSGTLFHRFCLERVERELQQAQIVCNDGKPHFVDFTLGAVPILPTPVRVGANEQLTGRGVTIAFVDSGFYPHPDLMQPVERIAALYDAVCDREITNIRGLIGRKPPVQAWHGTMAAATAAGNGFRSGGTYRGLACNARLVLVRAMTPRYRIRTPQVVRALRWILNNRERFDIRVVNLSLGVDETTDSMEHPVIALVEELTARGVVVVAASGNNPSNPIKPPGAAPSAITVGGYNDHNSTEWMHRELWHSSYGNTPGGGRKPELLGPAIWVAAPILPNTAVKEEAEALLQLACADDDELRPLIPELAGRTAVGKQLLEADGAVHARSIVLARIAAEKIITADYKHVDGTSFAAPIVTSVVAQMLEVRPSLSPSDVKTILMATALPLANVPSEVQGHGLVAPDLAVAATLGLREPGIIT